MLRGCKHTEKGGIAAAGVHAFSCEFEGLLQLALMKIRGREVNQGTRVVGAQFVDALSLFEDFVVLTRVEIMAPAAS
jgi:hypothetical protein